MADDPLRMPWTATKARIPGPESPKLRVPFARVAELVYAVDLKLTFRKEMRVRVPPRAPFLGFSPWVNPLDERTHPNGTHSHLGSGEILGVLGCDVSVWGSVVAGAGVGPDVGN
jgi:hypothetical protein